MEGIQGVWRFSANAGCQKLVIESKVLYASAMAMTVDYSGFGLSEGLHGYIPNFDELVGDVIKQFTNVKGRSEVKGLPFFVMGESMGGAMSLKIHLKELDKWDGVIVVAPTCKILIGKLLSSLSSTVQGQVCVFLGHCINLAKTKAMGKNSRNRTNTIFFFVLGEGLEIDSLGMNSKLMLFFFFFFPGWWQSLNLAYCIC
ncbi:hypothetical protein C1H46_039025 [Malus baccata]|uniref:Serine aminopeptidase S33 domain-containing protein n=1 Tax=Malus baccata TaxID=106549 RepID=A0A540KMM9_MALBA|nr:hypothetical protein C1H46_039025 [Malus baccata]